MKHFHPKSVIRIIEEKRVQHGSKGSRQWQLLKRFEGKTVEDFEHEAKRATELAPPNTYQKANWWVRELDYCWNHKVISVEQEAVHNQSPIRSTPKKPASRKHIHDQTNHNEIATLQPLTVSEKTTPKTSSNQINMNGTGIYIAYPTSPILKPIYRGYKTKVNNTHTKIGIAKDSFYARKNSYIKTFDGEVEFYPIVQIKPEILESVEQEILYRLSQHFLKVGWAREWFNTDDRDMFLKIILEITK